MGMTIVNLVKKGIEIPELVFEVLPGDTGVKVLAIDKVKYADWLQNQIFFCVFSNPEDGSLTCVFDDYLGDEKTLISDGVNQISIYAMSSTFEEL